MKKIIFIFIISFILNLIWENLHSVLYVHYMGGEITEFILFRAAVFDAVVTTLVITPFLYVVFLKKYNWLIIAILFFIAVYIEYYAIGTDRWAYDALMPIVPFLGTGLTPTVQLGFLGYLTFKITERV